MAGCKALLSAERPCGSSRGRMEACLDVVGWEVGGSKGFLGRLLLARKGPCREHHSRLVWGAGHAGDPVACTSISQASACCQYEEGKWTS